MGSSKRKSSFRIDDILQQQQQQGSPNNLLSPLNYQHYHHLHQNQQSTTTSSITSDNKSVNSPLSSPELVIDTSRQAMNSNHSSRTQNNPNAETSGSKTTGHPPTANVEAPYASPSGSDGGSAPRKPHPVYPSFPDMQKHAASNFYLPLSLGMPQFSPAAYLEHYANALQKGEWK